MQRNIKRKWQQLYIIHNHWWLRSLVSSTQNQIGSQMHKYKNVHKYHSQIHTNADEVLSRATLHLQPASDGLNTTCLLCQLSEQGSDFKQAHEIIFLMSYKYKCKCKYKYKYEI